MKSIIKNEQNKNCRYHILMNGDNGSFCAYRRKAEKSKTSTKTGIDKCGGVSLSYYGHIKDAVLLALSI